MQAEREAAGVDREAGSKLAVIGIGKFYRDIGQFEFAEEYVESSAVSMPAAANLARRCTGAELH